MHSQRECFSRFMASCPDRGKASIRSVTFVMLECYQSDFKFKLTIMSSAGSASFWRVPHTFQST
jgi:hypothetical protein